VAPRRDGLVRTAGGGSCGAPSITRARSSTCSASWRDTQTALRLIRKLLKKPGLAPKLPLSQDPRSLPRLHSHSLVASLGRSPALIAKRDVVNGRGVGGRRMDVDKKLRGSSGSEPLHFALSSPHDLMGVFSAIVPYLRPRSYAGRRSAGKPSRRSPAVASGPFSPRKLLLHDFRKPSRRLKAAFQRAHMQLCRAPPVLQNRVGLTLGLPIISSIWGRIQVVGFRIVQFVGRKTNGRAGTAARG
jgi:hypothetical protein